MQLNVTIVVTVTPVLAKVCELDVTLSIFGHARAGTKSNTVFHKRVQEGTRHFEESNNRGQ